MTRVVNIIPTYNEKENISQMLSVLEKIARQNKNFDFFHLIVDDNSPDGTATIVKARQQQNPNIFLLAANRVGLGEAIIRGYKFAIKKLKADIIVTNDCDFSFDPYLIPNMLQKIEEGYDVVIGSRHIKGGSSHGWTFFRRFNHFVANRILAWYVAGLKQVKDHNGNFRTIRVKNVLDSIKWEQIRVKGFGFLMYMTYLLQKRSNRFFEIPVTFSFRTRGESKVSFNPKYINTYIRDIFEYTKICLMIRSQK